MTDFAVRLLQDNEVRAAHSVLREALLSPPITDDQWDKLKPTYAPDRYFGAVADSEVVSSMYIFDSAVAVPGGEAVPMAGLSRVGVRADFTRRGVLTEMMRVHMADAKARGQVLAGLKASETGIYGRFGYGPSTGARQIRLRGAKVRPELPVHGQIRIIDGKEAVDIMPSIYRRVGLYRPGMMSRSPDWWRTQFDRRMYEDEPYRVAVHSGPDGDDGYVIFTTTWTGSDYQLDQTGQLEIADLCGATPAVRADLWRFVLGIDLIKEIMAHNRPVDEGLELLLVDSRTCRTADLDDELWLRLVDVPAALAGRTYGDAEPVAITVNDSFLPDNSGTYLVSRDGVTSTTQPGELELDVSVLAMIYLGYWKPSMLATAGRLRVVAPGALEKADRLFASDTIAWCGTGF